MRLALTLNTGVELEGDELDVQRLLKYTSAFGSGQESATITRRTTTSGGVSEEEIKARWINGADVTLIREVSNA